MCRDGENKEKQNKKRSPHVVFFGLIGEILKRKPPNAQFPQIIWHAKRAHKI